MSTLQPTPEDGSSAGRWTVGRQARVPSGQASRPAVVRPSQRAVEHLPGER